MKRNSLDLLACPACHAPLTLHDRTAGPLDSGHLHCERCQKDYPLEQGIPHFIQPEQLTAFNRRFARMYDWFSWGYRAFSKIAFAYIGMSEETGRREITDRLEPRGGRGGKMPSFHISILTCIPAAARAKWITSMAQSCAMLRSTASRRR